MRCPKCGTDMYLDYINKNLKELWVCEQCDHLQWKNKDLSKVI